jgi:hypothetical protein
MEHQAMASTLSSGKTGNGGVSPCFCCCPYGTIGKTAENVGTVLICDTVNGWGSFLNHQSLEDGYHDNFPKNQITACQAKDSRKSEGGAGQLTLDCVPARSSETSVDVSRRPSRCVACS